MKRKIHDVVNKDSTLVNFKKTIMNQSHHIINKEMNKIIPRNLDKQNTERYILEQYDLDPINGKILDVFIDSIKHIPVQKMFQDIEQLSTKLWDNIKNNTNKSFYIVLTGRKNITKGVSLCIHKSNMFLAIIALCYNKNLLENFQDFVCDRSPLHSESLSQDVPNYVFIDDASFTGRQMSSEIMSLGVELLDLNFPHSTFNLHLMVLYSSESSKNKILHTSMSDFPGESHWYSTETHPVNLDDIILSLKYDHKIDEKIIYSAAKAFTRDYPGNHGEMDKPLFYTDIKIADTVSIYSRFLLDPVLVDSKFKTQKLTYPIITNCELPIEGESSFGKLTLFYKT